MTWWALLLWICAVWVLWIVVCVASLRADVAEKKRPSDAGFSFVPAIPVIPAALFGLAKLLDHFAPMWGTFVIARIHLIYAALLLYTTLRDLRRERTACSLYGGDTEEGDRGQTHRSGPL